MDTVAVVMQQPEQLALSRVELNPAGDDDVVVDVAWSGISTGTERLLWSGQMPPFPGMGYPLVPGYESVGRVAQVGAGARVDRGALVFVPGARCFASVRALFGGAAARLVVPAKRVVRFDESLAEQGVLLALAATARHAMAAPDAAPPELVIGHGVLGRLLARVAIADGHRAPVVWEINPGRRDGARGYEVVDPGDDDTRTYRSIYDVSGDGGILDRLVGRLASGGQIVLAGFYHQRLSFDFPPAFMREARIRCAAEFTEADLAHVLALLRRGALCLDGLITHRESPAEAEGAYRTAFNDPSCLKMILDWRNAA